MSDDDHDPKLTPMTPEERERRFGIPAKPASRPSPSAGQQPVAERLELDAERAGPPPAGVVDRIRVGGLAVVVRVFVFSAVMAFLLFEGLHRVYRH